MHLNFFGKIIKYLISRPQEQRHLEELAALNNESLTRNKMKRS